MPPDDIPTAHSTPMKIFPLPQGCSASGTRDHWDGVQNIEILPHRSVNGDVPCSPVLPKRRDLSETTGFIPGPCSSPAGHPFSPTCPTASPLSPVPLLQRHLLRALDRPPSLQPRSTGCPSPSLVPTHPSKSDSKAASSRKPPPLPGPRDELWSRCFFRGSGTCLFSTSRPGNYTQFPATWLNLSSPLQG